MQTTQTNLCSSALTVETQNPLGQRTPVTSVTAVTFTGPSPSSISFFSDPQCLTAPNATVQIPSGQASATIHFRATQAGMPVITASSTLLTSAMQTQNVVSPPNQLVFVTNPPAAPILAGQCFLATVEARFNGVVAPALSDASISLQPSPTGSLRFFSNATCTASTSAVSMPSGQSRASFYVKPISGGLNTVIASAPFGSAQLQFTVVGVVRRGACVLSSLQSTVTCPITPAHQSMARTMVVYQATSSSDGPVDSEVRCRLLQPDQLFCERSGSGNQATIAWQTAELVSGMNVQRSFAPTCLPSLVTLPTAANPSSSFVLSSFTGIGTNYDGDDLSAARLVMDGGAVFLDNRSQQSCAGYEFQVVELSGVTTLRGSVSGMSVGQRTANVNLLPPASPNTVLFNQSLLSSVIPNSTSVCNLMVRAEIDAPTTLVFSRGESSLGLNCNDVPLTELAWERVDFGSRARVQTIDLNVQNNSFDTVISAVDPTRTLVFAGGQAAGGQASGETDFDNQGDDSVGVGTVRFDLSSPTNVRVTRGRSSGDARIMMYVVELEP